MFSGFLSKGNWEGGEENKSPQHATTESGISVGVNFFMFPKKRNDFSDPEHMEAMPLSYKGEEDFFFPYFLEWLDPSSYLLGKWFRLDEDQEMSGKRTTERHFPGSEMPIPDVTGPLPKLSPINFVCDFPNLVEWRAVLDTRPPFH